MLSYNPIVLKAKIMQLVTRVAFIATLELVDFGFGRNAARSMGRLRRAMYPGGILGETADFDNSTAVVES